MSQRSRPLPGHNPQSPAMDLPRPSQSFHRLITRLAKRSVAMNAEAVIVAEEFDVYLQEIFTELAERDVRVARDAGEQSIRNNHSRG